nr:MAG TPA: metallophosphatase domain protein [Caudoviricetes sp.]
MHNILIVPDIHGRTFWKKLNPNDADLIIFLGDYTDPYNNENITPEMAINNLKELVNFYNKYKDKCVCLKGNHDYPYISELYKKNFDYLCRHDYEHEEEIASLLKELNLKDCYTIDNYIFSHAGFNNHYWKLIQPGFKVGESISDVLSNYPELAARVSWRRGGVFNYGSHVWEDLHYFLESSPNKELSKYIQIFGHTFIKKAIHHNNCYCLDCQDIFKLNLETRKLCYASGKEITEI